MAKTKRRRSQAQKKSGPLPLIIAVAAVLLVVGGLIILNWNATKPVVASVSVDFPTGITEDGQPYKGGADATVVLEEFSDFGCPHCRNFAETLDAISDDYIKTGKIKVIFRNFVLSPRTLAAARGGECALDQGADAFWAYHDAVFANQARGDAIYAPSGIKSIAKQIGLDTAAFNKCMDTNQKTAEIQKDSQDGDARGIDSTPTLYFNGEKFLGAMPAAELRAKLDSMLGQ